MSLRFEDDIFEPEEDPVLVSWKLCRALAFGNGGRSPANMAGVVFSVCVVS